MLRHSIFLALLVFPSVAIAEPASNHRIAASIGLGVTLADADVDNHWREASGAPGLSVEYDYAAASFLEVGAGIRYWNFGLFSDDSSMQFNGGEYGIHHGLAPSAQVRFHTRGRFELGATLGGGLLMLHQNLVPDREGYDSHAHTWLGWQASAAIDGRFWVSSHWAVFGQPTFMYGKSTDHGDTRGFYLSENALFGSLQFWLGAVYAP